MPEEARWAETAIAWCPSSAKGAIGRGWGLQPLHQAPGLLCVGLMVPPKDHGWEEEAIASPVLGESGGSTKSGSAKPGSSKAQWER